MEAQKDYYPIALMCRVLGASRSGYYAWCQRPPSTRQLQNQLLLQKLKEVFAQSRQSYGSPRMQATLRAEGFAYGRHRIARLMRQAGLVARCRKGSVPKTTESDPSLPVAVNLLAREFTAPEPDSKWVADITYLPSSGGWVYLAVVIDLFSRRVVGWSMAQHLQTELVLTALRAALGKPNRKLAITRVPAESGLLFHSDRGSQYASRAYQQVLGAAGITCSMSRTGNCWDNAVAESFFSTLKTELIYRLEVLEPEELRTTVAEWLEVFYNRQRRHSVLGYLSPDEYERNYWKEVKLASNSAA